MVAPLGRIKAGDYSAVQRDVAAVLAERPAGGIIKVILETGALTDEEILGTVQALNDLDIDFYKTSTGFGTGGATVPDVRLMKASIPDTMKVKASGGMHSWQEAVDMVEAGASRLGTSSTLAILEGAPA